MNNIIIQEKNSVLSSIIDQVNESHQATMITIEHNKKAVLISLEDWQSIQETLYLMSIQGVKDDLIEGKNTPWEDCTPFEELNW